MDDNWWPWRRGDRDEGLPPPPPSRRHGARSVVGGGGGTGRPAAARERRTDRWVGGWLVLGGSDGVSVGRPPCCCGVRACRRRVVVTRACGCVRARATRPSEPAAAADETLALGHCRRRCRPTVNNNNITPLVVVLLLLLLFCTPALLYIYIYHYIRVRV